MLCMLQWKVFELEAVLEQEDVKIKMSETKTALSCRKYFPKHI